MKKRITLCVLVGCMAIGFAHAQHFVCQTSDEYPIATRGASPSASGHDDAPSISDGIFRPYRLAVYMSYNEYNSPKFSKNKDKIKRFWAELETFLNEIYVRDLGVHFTIVNDERLIETTRRGAYTYLSGPKLIDDAIGNDAYDLGIVLDFFDASGIDGKADLGGVQDKSSKARAIVTSQDMVTIAHELGHMFGARHPFTRSAGMRGLGTEPESGQSLVSYGHPYKNDFISLESLKQMRIPTANADKHLPKTYASAANTAPRIDRSKMKKEYRIPKGTYFTIPIYASDAEQEVLSYYFNQYGCTLSNPATFPVFPPQHDNVLRFGQRISDGLSIVANSEQIPVGDYRFWFAVSDALPIEQAIEKKQAPLFDSYLARVKVVEATPFKISSPIKKQYEMGSRLHLTWDVDRTFFPSGSKVRIVMSDDVGKTFRHVLMPSTDNDGECDIYMPQQLMDKIATYSITDANTGKKYDLLFAGRGVIRLETIDDDVQYYDITNQEPDGGGIEVIPSKVKFSDLLKERYIRISAQAALPDVPEVKASVGNQSVMPTYMETTNDNLTIRTWSVEHEGETYGVQQFIVRGKDDAANSISLPESSVVSSDTGVSVGDGTIKIDRVTAGQSVVVYDLQGHVVAEKTGSNAPMYIRVPGRGIYVLSIGATGMQKVVVGR